MSGFEMVFWRSLDQQQIELLEELEYGFLSELGYRVKGCRLYAKRRKRLKNALKRDRARLTYVIRPGHRVRGVLYYYVYRKKGHTPITSKVVRFLFGGDAGGNEGQREG